eukprot:3060885-Amphidinium_carterae.1
MVLSIGYLNVSSVRSFKVCSGERCAYVEEQPYRPPPTAAPTAAKDEVGTCDLEEVNALRFEIALRAKDISLQFQCMVRGRAENRMRCLGQLWDKTPRDAR